MKTWFIFSIITFLLWGLWGFLGKLAGSHMSDKSLLFSGIMAFVFVLPLVWLIYPEGKVFDIKNIYHYIGLLSGLAGGLGVVFFYAALKRGDASKVVVLTALYPLVTVILSFFILHEKITVYKVIGITCALTATLFLSL